MFTPSSNVWVRGHSGLLSIERADGLVRRGAEDYPIDPIPITSIYLTEILAKVYVFIVNKHETMLLNAQHKKKPTRSRYTTEPENATLCEQTPAQNCST